MGTRSVVAVVVGFAALAAMACGPSTTPPVAPDCPDDARGGDDIDIDVGIACDESSIDRGVILAAPRSRLTSTELPAGLRLEADGEAWRLRGTTPAVTDFVDASFDADDATTFERCTYHTAVHVRFLIDSCDGTRDACEEDATSFPILGFCAPNKLDAGVAFSLATATTCVDGACNEVRPAVCHVAVNGNRISLAGDACVHPVDTGCESSCGGGFGAPCEVPPLPPGHYTISSANGELAVDIPRALAPDAPRDCVQPF